MTLQFVDGRDYTTEGDSSRSDDLRTAIILWAMVCNMLKMLLLGSLLDYYCARCRIAQSQNDLIIRRTRPNLIPPLVIYNLNRNPRRCAA